MSEVSGASHGSASHHHKPGPHKLDELLEANANLGFTINGSWTTQLQVTGATTGGVQVSYTNPPNNPFSTNNLYMFNTQQGSTSLPGTAAISAAAPAPASGGTVIYPAGSGSFGAIPYIVAYSLNPGVTTTSGGVSTTTYPDIVATAYIPGAPITDPTQVQYFAPSLTINNVQPQLLSFTYTFPPGFNPSNSAWVAIWMNQNPPYSGSPLAVGMVRGSANSGPVFVMVSPQNPIASHTGYTAALFSSGWNTNPALLPTNNVATYTYFTTGGPIGK